MKVFVTGVTGQLGYDGMVELVKCGYQVIGSGRRPCEDIEILNQPGLGTIRVPYIQQDITDQKAVRETIERISPDVIIHCAAWTDVDAAEDEENKSKVDAVNHLGTKYIAEAAKAVNAKMVYISTDYVFDGQGKRPWKPDDKCRDD